MKRSRTFLELLAEQSDENPEPKSIAEGLGLLHLHLHRLKQELALSAELQDAENLLQELVGLASMAAAMGDAHVIPEISGEVDE